MSGSRWTPFSDAIMNVFIHQDYRFGAFKNRSGPHLGMWNRKYFSKRRCGSKGMSAEKTPNNFGLKGEKPDNNCSNFKHVDEKKITVETRWKYIAKKTKALKVYSFIAGVKMEARSCKKTMPKVWCFDFGCSFELCNLISTLYYALIMLNFSIQNFYSWLEKTQKGRT